MARQLIKGRKVSNDKKSQNRLKAETKRQAKDCSAPDPRSNLNGGARFNARMADNRTISQLEAEGYPWIGCECCKGTVWVPFRMLRERIPMLSAMTLDQLGAKMRCDKCGKLPERYYPANQSDTPGFVRRI